jgi:uncharacterized protein (DUF2336 family)
MLKPSPIDQVRERIIDLHTRTFAAYPIDPAMYNDRDICYAALRATQLARYDELVKAGNTSGPMYSGELTQIVFEIEREVDIITSRAKIAADEASAMHATLEKMVVVTSQITSHTLQHGVVPAPHWWPPTTMDAILASFDHWCCPCILPPRWCTGTFGTLHSFERTGYIPC